MAANSSASSGHEDVSPASFYSGSATANTCSYTVESGDTLWKIAQAVYGDGSAYPKIIEKNKDKYTNIASVLAVGQELTFDCQSNSAVQGASDTRIDEKPVASSADSQGQQPSETKSSKWWNPLSWF